MANVLSLASQDYFTCNFYAYSNPILFLVYRIKHGESILHILYMQWIGIAFLLHYW